MDKKQDKFSIQKRIKSFTYAFNGLKVLIKEEHNFRIHLVIALFAVVVGFFLKLSAIEWIMIVFAIGMVLTLEIINSAIENIADFVSPQKHDMIKKIKDISAASVIIGALTAVVIGLIIFIPKLILLCSNC